MKEGSNIKETEKAAFLGSKIWKSAWFILSALMNAISLINIGIDLKVVIFRWGAFFERSFELIRTFTNAILAPFIFLFGFFHVEIPRVIKDVFFFCFLLMTVLARAYNKRTKTYKEEGFAKKFRRIKYIKLFSYVWVVLLGVLTGFGLGVFIAGITWIGYALAGNAFLYFSFLLIFTLFLIFFLPLTWWQKSPQNAYLKKRVVEYILTVLVIAFLICLINYFYISYTSTE